MECWKRSVKVIPGDLVCEDNEHGKLELVRQHGVHQLQPRQIHRLFLRIQPTGYNTGEDNADISYLFLSLEPQQHCTPLLH